MKQYASAKAKIMKNISGKVEILSNVVIIVVAILLGTVLISRYLISPPPNGPAAEPSRIQAGTVLPLADVDWSKSSKTLVMVLSTSCRFCTDSIPFYQKLSKQKGTRSDIRLLVLLPQTAEESGRYLSEHGISVDEVRRAQPSEVYAKGTPTLIVVDREGKVIDSWVGKLPPEKEDEVISSVFGRDVAVL